ncbi:hypothetical protein IR010_00725 [Flavobacterium sp. MR2016-29]|uniref:hypothetical protein n=1 Tax=Flavobacterium sp. MR2016-29 TaxID=2783795 RepID=UPI00188C9B7F|nr:hypothetical protein [Flavobacterium sp. MR2016-29]MBF4491046.1 hypothetical protein [Flavobacterium sp. MR2016-29]
MESLNKINYLDVLNGVHPPKEKKVLPTLLCGSCGNCILNYHNEPTSNIDNGFCVKWFQNVDLNEKNVACWTSKQNTYYEQLGKLSTLEKKEDLHKRNKRASKLNIEFNQQTLF